MIMLAPRLVRLVAAYWRAGLTLAAPLLLTAVPLSGAQENVSALWTLYTILVTPAPPRHCYPTHAPAQVMAVFWIFELMPLPITSLLPLVLLPLAGVASTDEVARNYLKVDRDGTLMSHIMMTLTRTILQATNLMFVASLIMAIAVEHSGFHRRLSLNLIGAVGTSQKLIMLGQSLVTLSRYFGHTVTLPRLHDLHHVPVHVDLQHGGGGADGANRGLHLRGHDRGCRGGGAGAGPGQGGRGAVQAAGDQEEPDAAGLRLLRQHRGHGGHHRLVVTWSL